MLSSFSSKAQVKDSLENDLGTSRKWHYGLNIGTSPGFYFSLPLTPALVMKKGQHFLLAGPTFFPFNDDEHVTYGFDVNYRFVPNHIHKRINFYFFISNSTIRNVYTGFSSVGNGNGIIRNQENTVGLIFHIGYGFDVRFLNRFHFNQHIGFGYMRLMEKTSKTGAINYNSKDVENYPSVTLGLGFGIDFGKR